MSCLYFEMSQRRKKSFRKNNMEEDKCKCKGSFGRSDGVNETTTDITEEQRRNICSYNCQKKKQTSEERL